MHTGNFDQKYYHFTIHRGEAWHLYEEKKKRIDLICNFDNDWFNTNQPDLKTFENTLKICKQTYRLITKICDWAEYDNRL